MPNLTELLDNPIIAAIKDDGGLEAALQSDCRVIFVLYGTVLNIERTVRRIHETGKRAVVHIDLIEGLSNREIAVDLLVKLCRPDGLISTRVSQLRRGQSLGLLTVQRAFLLDSMSVDSLLSQMESFHPDYLELMPGILPRIIAHIAERADIPIIAGGLVQYKQDVIDALRAGAVAVSTTSGDVWKM